MLKLIIFLDLVTICITRARHIRVASKPTLVDILGRKHFNIKKRVQQSQKLQEEKMTMTIVLKLLNNQIG